MHQAVLIGCLKVSSSPLQLCIVHPGWVLIVVVHKLITGHRSSLLQLGPACRGSSKDRSKGAILSTRTSEVSMMCGVVARGPCKAADAHAVMKWCWDFASNWNDDRALPLLHTEQPNAVLYTRTRR